MELNQPTSPKKSPSNIAKKVPWVLWVLAILIIVLLYLFPN
jgi:hypothetical protein